MTKEYAYVFHKVRDPNSEHSIISTSVYVHDHDTDLTDLLEAFTHFLRGAGFMVEFETLQIVKDETE